MLQMDVHAEWWLFKAPTETVESRVTSQVAYLIKEVPQKKTA